MNKKKTMESSISNNNKIIVKDKIDFLKYYDKPDKKFNPNKLQQEVFWRDQKINGIHTGKVEIKPVSYKNEDVIKEINRIKD